MVYFQFKIKSNAPRSYIDRWNELKYKCEHGNTKELAFKWLQNCKIETNRALPFINIGGGVIGQPKKYVRFRLKLVDWWENDVFIVFDRIHQSGSEKWSLEELDDLRFAFQQLCNVYVLQTTSEGRVKANLVKGYLKHGTIIVSS